jgi:DNA-binding NarL/FixJ family response regulator
MTALTDRKLITRPQMIVAHGNAGYAKSVSRHYYRLGWDCHIALSGLEVRQLAQQLSPAVVVLGTDWPGESGWLICGKLLDEHPDLKVILVTEQSTPANRHFACFLGAAGLVNEEGGVRTLAEEVDTVVEGPLLLARN